MRRVVDLSFPITVQDPRGTVRMVPYRTIAEHAAMITLVTFDTHVGTHLDAPAHQVAGAPTLESVDLEKCIGPAAVIDLTSKRLPHQLIEVADLEPFAEQVQTGGRLLIRTDWSDQYGQPGWTDGYPALTVESAQWLVAREIVLLGIDTPSVAPIYLSRKLMVAVHAPLLRAGVVVVESLTNLRALGRPKVTFVALPLNLVGTDGCPVRAVAVEE
ncbi:MAG: cyclase family protein [Chloroflexi bacterium]|nr:cyclase family protein [Chloroflexota bacterium]